MPWLVFASLSAVSAAGTAILAKVGVEGVPATLAMALRTLVVTTFAWGMVLGLGQQHDVHLLSRRTVVFLVLSGLTTGVSWLAYFRALQLAPASWVAPIDKLSLPLTVILAVLLLGESITWRAALGVTMMVAGALLTRA